MASNIDVSQPVQRHPNTAAERANWLAAHDEISALQDALAFGGSYGGIVEALGYIPYDAANPALYQTQSQVATSLVAIQGILPPHMDGDAAAGSSVRYAREDHTHPSNTSLASTLLPVMAGVAASGTGTKYSREDHIHPIDTSRYDAANPSHYQSDTQVSVSIAASVANYVPLTQRGTANGVASLDATGVIFTAQLPAVATGTLSYRGIWDPVTNTPTLATGGVGGANRDYFVVSRNGTSTAIDGVTVWVAGDWIVNATTVWQRVQTSSGFGSMASQNAVAVSISGGTITGLTHLSSTDLAFLDGSSNQPITYPMPDMARVWRDTAGNIPMAFDNTGLVLMRRLQVFGPTVLAGLSVTGGISEVGDLTVSGNLSVTGTGNFTGMLAPAAITFPNSDVEQVGSTMMPDLARWIRDTLGNIIFGFSTTGSTIVNNLQVVGTLTAPGFIPGSGDDPNSFSASQLSSRDALATANSMAVRGQTNSQIAQPVWTHNMVLIYGQSLAVGNQGLPRASTNEGLDNLTLGLAPGGVQTSTDYVFIPDTNSLINPLDGTRGYETPGIAATNQWRALQLQWRDLTTDPTRRIIVNGCAEGGKSIEELSKGYAVPCYYDRIPSLLNQVKAAVLAANPANTFGVVAVYYLQGEANYNPTWDSTQAGYAAKWEQLRRDIATDVAAITGQKLPPAFFASQPNSEWDNSGHITSIGDAFVQVGITPPLGDYLCMPNYQVPNSNPNGPHMSPDGYRMMGNQVGHIMHRVFDRGEGWFPLYVVKATYRGRQILLECHVPEPPLQTQAFYGGTDGSTVQPILSDLGFSAGDDLGALTISTIKLYNSVILLTCSRNVSTNAWVDYANNVPHGGCGNVCDSDPFLSLDVFKTLPAAMLGQPYPGWNWLVAFRMNVVSDV